MWMWIVSGFELGVNFGPCCGGYWQCPFGSEMCPMHLAGPYTGDLAPLPRKGIWRQNGSSWRKIPLCTGAEAKAERRALANAAHTPKYCTGQWAPYRASSYPAHTFDHAWCSSGPRNVWNSHSCHSAISPPDQQGAIESCLQPQIKGWKKKLISNAVSQFRAWIPSKMHT